MQLFDFTTWKFRLHFLQEVTLNEVNDENNGDSSDTEGDELESDDDDAELSFESDDEGNYQQNQKRAAEIARKFSENDSDFIDGDEDGEEEADSNEDEDDVSGEEAESDESENESIENEEHAEGSDSELSFEESESSGDEEPSQSIETAKRVEKKITEIKKSALNGVGAAAINGEASKPKVSTAEAFKNELNGRDPSKKEEVDEYAAHDTDDEEDIRNTVGNIPMHWYDEYKHIGYDWDAKKIIKPAKRDQLDDFLKRMEDPDFWRTVKDPQTGQDVILSEADIDLIKRINSQRIPDADFDDYAVRKFPMRNFLHFPQINNFLFVLF